MALEIPIQEQGMLFKQHLHDQGNDRIIFSGAFGVGKTYFLDKYFFSDDSEYLAIKLAPVNYSVSSNEDIFNLIKYDILYELAFIHRLALEGEKIDLDIALGVMLPAKGEAIIQSFLPFLPLLNKPSDAIPIVFAALTTWLAIGKDINKQRKEASEETEVLAFGEKIAAHYQIESDYVTNFLENGLNRVAESLNKKYKVLIIDDLDRIDPEHIFRLFNIFSAHLDYNKEVNNKFGFDKIIFVCDIKNIRNIFHNRYGADTDFTGYIDKFYSKEVYYFSNIEQIKKSVTSLLNSIKLDEQHIAYFNRRILKGDRRSGQSMIALILTELIHSEILTMRRIKASYELRYRMPTGVIGLDTPNSRDVQAWQIPAVVAIDLLSKILGGADVLIKSIENLQRRKRSEEYVDFTSRDSDWLLGNLLPIVDYKNHRFKTNNINRENTYSYKNNSGQTIEYHLIEYGDRHEFYYGQIKSVNGEIYNGQAVDFMDALDESAKILKQAGFIR